MFGIDLAAWWVKPVAYVLGAALLAGAFTWYRHSLIQQGWDERDKDFQAFKADVDATGKAAAAKAIWEDHNNELRKEKADAENATTRAALAVALNSLRVEADHRSFTVPGAPAGSSRPDLACFDRAEYQRAHGESLVRLRRGARGIADEGTACTIDLNTAKNWEQKK